MNSPSRRGLDKTVLLLLLALLVFASPLARWWASGQPPWYLPYLLWGGLIGLIALLSRPRHPHDH